MTYRKKIFKLIILSLYFVFISNILYAQNNSDVEAEQGIVEDSVEDPVENRVEDPVENQVEDPVENRVEDPVLEVEEEVNTEVLMFRNKADIFTANDIIEGSFFKGGTLYWNTKENTRYAVIARSSNLDTLIQLVYNNGIEVYKDLYLGEDAGIVFTASNDEVVSLKIYSVGNRDGTITASEILQSRIERAKKKVGKEDVLNDELDVPEEDPVVSAWVGEYIVDVYELTSLPNMISIPYKQEHQLNPESLIAYRVATEYRVNFEQDKRAYVRMFSSEFDTLLELSDKSGRTVVSDDWSEGMSLISVEIPNDDEFYITATSFDGAREGAYELEVIMTDNVLLQEITGKLSIDSPKILNKYSQSYDLPLREGDYIMAEVQALDHDIEIVFVRNNLDALYTEYIKQGETRKIPLYASDASPYKLLVLSAAGTTINYKVTLYR